MARSSLGAKALAILTYCDLPADVPGRAEALEKLVQKFSAKAVKRKAHELAVRGYLATGMVSTDECPLERSWLTTKGRETLDAANMSG